MAAEQRKLLEQLMGAEMLSGNTSRAPQLSITDPKVCRSYLVGTCPYDLFTNTKQDLGTCNKTHSEALKNEYEAASEEQKKKWAFDYDYMHNMKNLLDDCNRKIETAQRRLDKTPEEIRQTNSLMKQIADLEENIRVGLQEVQCLAKGGAVNMALTDFFKIRQFHATKADRERDLKALADTGGPSGHQKLQVCDVCGAYLSRLDNDRRLADHFYGKMHLGYAQMRKTYDALAKEWKGKLPPHREEPSARDMDGGYPDRDRNFRGGYRSGRGGYGGYGRRGGGYGGGYGGRGWN